MCTNSDDGACALISVVECDKVGGTYMGHGVPCDPNPCPTSGVPDYSFEATALEAPVPNPAFGDCLIRFRLREGGPVELVILNVTGRTVATLASRILSAGLHEIPWDGCGPSGAGMPSGVYYVTLKTPEARLVERLVIAR